MKKSFFLIKKHWDYNGLIASQMNWTTNAILGVVRMMISKTYSTKNNINTSWGVFAFIAGAMMLVDAYSGGLFRQSNSMLTIEYVLVSLLAIAAYGESIKDSGACDLELDESSFHGL